MAERTTIIDFLEKYTRLYSEHVYLKEKPGEEWIEITYEQTREEAWRIGAGLMALGVEKGEKVALLSEGRAMWVLAEFGAMYAGLTDVPLSINLREGHDLTYRINHSEATWILVSAYQLPKIRKVLPECPQVKKVIVFDDAFCDIDELQDKEIFMSQVQRMGDELLATRREDFEERIHSIGPDDYANISYTSGTTADTKGILLTHRNYTANVEQTSYSIKFPMYSTMLLILPLDHCYAHVAGIYLQIFYGAHLAFVPPGKTSMATLKNSPMAIRETRPQVMLSVPALTNNFKKNIENSIKAKSAFVQKLYAWGLSNAIKYNKDYYNRGGLAVAWRKPFMALYDKLIFKKIRESFGGRMEFFVSGGAMVDINLQYYFCAIGIPIFQGYGLSEATPIVSANTAGHAVFGSSGRIGRPMDCKICDEAGNELPDGQKGEIVIRGENVMAGYWKNPEATAATVVDGWLHTGDMGYKFPLDPEYLFVVGRFKSMLVSSDGEKYCPEGFENNLATVSPYISQVVLHNNQEPHTMVLIVPDKEALREYALSKGVDPASDKGKRLMLGKILKEVNSYRKGEVRSGLFPERWLPSSVVICDEPFTVANKMMNSTNKIVRGKVEEHYAERIAFSYTPAGKDICNPGNMAAIE